MASKVQTVLTKIRMTIDSDKSIREPGKVSISAQKTMPVFGKTKIVLTGRATSESEKKYIEELVQNTASGFEVESRLGVRTT